ncbi:hypothetical protein T01_967 [Trichinella spiralis]|uniref:Uncharacterized protein n=1 Tax=Trichinella spiralis TaxID=6334 RepID=A0A0V1BKA4_TRISP|nr:hypothetical protein T01_967 [Trichinella spiralis]
MLQANYMQIFALRLCLGLCLRQNFRSPEATIQDTPQATPLGSPEATIQDTPQAEPSSNF